MRDKTRRTQIRKSGTYKYVIFLVIIIAAAQFWLLKTYYKELEIKLPDDLSSAPGEFPIIESTISVSYEESKLIATESVSDQNSSSEETNGNYDNGSDTSQEEDTIDQSETILDEPSENYSNSIEGMELSDIQKKIILRLMELIEEDIEYGYETFPETGYPTNNIWISTDVISVVLRDCGYDLMDLIYNDMLEHKEDYPLDIKGRNEPLKHLDFRHVFFQEQFFKRHALGLDNEFIIDNEDNAVQWQPGDIIYFQFDPDDPYQDLGGFISSRSNDNGVPLVIMISKDFGKVSEVDVLSEYKVVGHYRYPNPYEEIE